MGKSYKLNGKYVRFKKDIPKNAKLVETVNEEHYETESYRHQEAINASNYFAKQSQIREDMDKYHG